MGNKMPRTLVGGRRSGLPSLAQRSGELAGLRRKTGENKEREEPSWWKRGDGPGRAHVGMFNRLLGVKEKQNSVFSIASHRKKPNINKLKEEKQIKRKFLSDIFPVNTKTRNIPTVVNDSSQNFDQ